MAIIPVMIVIRVNLPAYKISLKSMSITSGHPYSINLTSLDYHLFQSLRYHLAKIHLKVPEKVNKSIENFTGSKPPFFFQGEICQLSEKQQKRIKVEKDYFKS